VTAGDDAEVVPAPHGRVGLLPAPIHRVRDDLAPFLEQAARRAEARFFHLMTTQRAGSRDQYIALTRALVEEFPSSSWAEEALNNLASFHIVNDEGEQADAVFREIVSRFPSAIHCAGDVEGGLARVPAEAVRRSGRRVRACGRGASARGLSAVVSLLGRQGARADR